MGEWVVEVLAFVATGFIGGLVWGLRLEGLVNQNSKDIDRIEGDHKHLVAKHEALDGKIMEKFSDVVEALARIEEKLKSKQSRGG